MSEAVTVPTSVVGDLPEGLMSAFDEYERALAADDTDALAAAFAPGPTTLRADASGLLVGHDAITAFRGRRGGIPPRRVVDCHVRVIDDAHALVVSVNAPEAGGRGIVTQLWVRGSDRWTIESAQVQAQAPAVDSRIWRVIGSPLVAPHLAADGDHEASLAGETVAVKDLFAIEHFAIGAGVPAYLASAPVQTAHAAAVSDLLRAGAAIRGIAQTDEFAYSIAGRNGSYGTPPNPAVAGAVSGGSSSGPATAVSLGHASIGLATDTAGSIRVPASYQGLWGIRTTHGAVDTTGLIPLAPSFDTVGWLTRSPDLLVRVATASLPAASDDASPALSDQYVVDPSVVAFASGEVRHAFDTGIRSLVDAGRMGEPQRIDLGDVAAVFEHFRVAQAAEAWQADGDWITAHPGALAPDVAARFAFAASITPDRLAEARAALIDARERFDAALGGRILLLPSASSVAPALDAEAAAIDEVRTATLRMTCVAGTGGYPAVSAPLLHAPGGPVGLCLVGPRGSDLALIGTAAALA